MHLKISTGNWRPFCLGLNALATRHTSNPQCHAFRFTPLCLWKNALQRACWTFCKGTPCFVFEMYYELKWTVIIAVHMHGAIFISGLYKLIETEIHYSYIHASLKKPPSVQIIFSRLFGANPLPEPMLPFLSIRPLETFFGDILIKIQWITFKNRFSWNVPCNMATILSQPLNVNFRSTTISQEIIRENYMPKFKCFVANVKDTSKPGLTDVFSQ